jgi:hypothetical protein
MRRRFCSIGVIAVGVVLAAGVGASAEPGKGAAIFRDQDCFTTAGQTICVDSRLVSHFAVAPAGNVHYIAHGDSVTTFEGPGSYERTYERKFHVSFLIVNSAEEQIDHFSERIKISEGGITCDYWVLFQEVDGDVKVDTRLTECAPTGEPVGR